VRGLLSRSGASRLDPHGTACHAREERPSHGVAAICRQMLRL
jgi:hypothetical protein